MSEKPKIGFIVGTAPYVSQNRDTAIRLADAAMDKGYAVWIMFTLSAPTAWLDSVRPKCPRPDFPLGEKGRRMPDLLKKLSEKGAKVSICPIFGSRMGVNKETANPSAAWGGVNPIAKWLIGTEKLLIFA
jgi:sulfur relay (sulfurtransferase) complex TusBCD TusD component (DsrE family)